MSLLIQFLCSATWLAPETNKIVFSHVNILFPGELVHCGIAYTCRYVCMVNVLGDKVEGNSGFLLVALRIFVIKISLVKLLVMTHSM